MLKLRHAALLALALLVAAIGWRYRHSELFSTISRSEPKHKVEIEFDNGTVRQLEPASLPAARPAVPQAVAGVWKCAKGGQITYGGTACPHGTKELPITGGTVNVVAGVERRADAAQAGSAKRRSMVFDVLDRSEEPTLTQKAIERATR